MALTSRSTSSKNCSRRCGVGYVDAERIDHHRHRALGLIAAVHAFHGHQRAEQEPSAEEQQHGGRDFRDDEQAANPAAASGGRASLAGQHLRRRHARRLPRRCQSEQDADEQRRHATEGEHTRVERNRDHSRQQARRQQGRSGLQNARADRHAQRSTDGCKDQAFGEELANDAATPRADR